MVYFIHEKLTNNVFLKQVLNACDVESFHILNPPNVMIQNGDVSLHGFQVAIVCTTHDVVLLHTQTGENVQKKLLKKGVHDIPIITSARKFQESEYIKTFSSSLIK